MPWSEWQEPFVIKLGPVYTLLHWDLPTNDISEVDTYTGDPFNGGYAVAESVDWLGSQTVTNAIQYRIQDGWQEVRDSLPPLLRGMERGVDYDVVPGKDQWADDAFVEYDPTEVNLWDGWGDDSGPHVLKVQGTGNTTVSGADSAYSVSADVGLAFDTMFPEEPGTRIGGIPAITELWASETVIGSGPVTAVEDVVIGSLPDPGNVACFTLVTRASVALQDGNPEGAGAVGAGSVLAFLPHQRVILPRWRYWIPDQQLPLRQRQRDDGLGLSTARWRRGRSRQSSNRWRGYL